MVPKRKPFGCLEMQNWIQARILAGFEASKDESPSFVEFVRGRTEKNERVGQMTE